MHNSAKTRELGALSEFYGNWFRRPRSDFKYEEVSLRLDKHDLAELSPIQTVKKPLLIEKDKAPTKWGNFRMRLSWEVF